MKKRFLHLIGFFTIVAINISAANSYWTGGSGNWGRFPIINDDVLLHRHQRTVNNQPENSGFSVFLYNGEDDTLRAPQALGITVTILTNNLCYGDCNASIFATVTGGSGGPYKFTWYFTPNIINQHLGTTDTVFNQCGTAGAINVSVKDLSTGNSVGTSFNINAPSDIVVIGVNITSPSCPGLIGCNGSIEPNVIGGTGSYNYQWTPSGQTTQNLTNVCGGNDTLRITDSNGCKDTSNYTITQPTTILPHGSKTNVKCFGASTGTATVAPTGGTSPYTYSWAPSGGTGATASGLAAGSYTCTITDGNGCIATYTVTITQPAAAISATVTQTNVTCTGGTNGSATVTPSGGTAAYTYSWNTTPTQTTQTASGLAAGTYVCTITDANLCTFNKTITITTLNAAPIATATPSTQSICYTGTAASALSSTVAGTTYSWTATSLGGTITGFTTSGTTNISDVLTNSSSSASGTVTYSITPTGPAPSSCVGSDITFVATVYPKPTVTNSPLTQTICSGSTASLTPTSAVAGTTFSWTASASAGTITGFTSPGNGNISDVITNTGAASGTVTYVITPTGPAPSSCVGTSSSFVVTVKPKPTATAGGTQTICSNGIATVSGATATNGSILWTENGAGSITSGATTLTPTYTAAAGDAGTTVILTMTVSNAPCTAATATYSVVVTGIPTATAGGTQTICANGTATVSGATSSNGTILWTENGAGSITSGATTLTPTYTATAADAGNTVTLTMTVSNAPCTAATAIYTVVVKGIPTATAGGTQTICSNGTATVSGATATNGSILWTENGAGSITSGATTLTPTYTASAADAGNTVILTMTVTNAPCAAATATYTIIVKEIPTATAGGTQTICSNGTATVSGATSSNGTILWTENGAGSITSGASTLTPTYTAAAADAGTTVTLTMTVSNAPCAAATATYTVIVKGIPTATAGGTQTICSNGTATVSGATATNGSILWTENGVGSITSGSTTLTPTYTAAAGDAGNTVILTMTVTNAPCADATATYTVIVKGVPTATAGGTQTICSNGTATVSGATSSNGTILWTENGAGSITSGASTLTPTYTASAADAGTTVTLTMTVSNAPCTAATATYSVVVNGIPTATAGGTQTICANGSAIVSGATSSNGTILWTENGAGSITSGANTLTPTYTAAAGDAGNTVILTMTVTNAPCTAATATYTVIVKGVPTATAGGTQTICSNGTATVSGATSSNGTILWTENGAGSITSGATTLTPTYTASAADAGTTVTLTMTVSNAPCAAATATYTVIVNGIPTATAGGTQNICANGTATVSGATSSNGTILWTENGVGSITSGSSTLTPTYTAAAGDAGNTVTLTMTVTNAPCAVATATYTVVVTGAPTATAGGTQTICANGTATVSGATSSNGTILWTENGAGSITSGATTLTPTYTASAADAGNVVTLTMSVTNATCPPATATYTINVNGIPTASAGGTQTICANGTAIVSGATSSNGTILWTENGAGSITSGSSTLTPTYTAAAGDAGNTVILTMTVSNAPCTAATATYAVIVNDIPTATAGGTQTICYTETATVSGATSSNGTILWTENGAGSITSGANTLTPTYTAAASDAGNTVILTMTVSNPPCADATATYSVVVTPLPTASAGGTQTICTNGTATVSGATASNGTISWTENGAGSITSGATTLTPTYTAVSADAGNTVTLTMTVTSIAVCGTSTVTATYTVIVNGIPTASAGGAQTICADGTATVSGATASNGTISWTENGAGSITAGVNTLTPTYTAAAGDGGNTVTLTMTVSNAPCTAATATYTVIVKGVPAATAGGSQTICPGGTAIVSGATSSNGSILWTENGAGSITSGASTLTPTYTSVAGDAGNTVTLTMTVSNAPCAAAIATYSVNVNPIPVVTNVSLSQIICSGDTASISPSSDIAGATFSWTASASAGTITGFSANGTGNVSEVITNSGTTSGTVTYVITPIGPSPLFCSGNPVDFVVTINPTPNSTATPALQTVCSGSSTSIALTSNVAGATFDWTVIQSNASGATAGSGNTIAEALTATSTSNGTVVYTVTSSANSCSGTPTNVTITVIPVPDLIVSPASQTICSGATTSLTLSSNTAGATFDWTVVQTNVSGASAGSGSTIIQALSAITSSVGTTVYTITSSFNGCSGSPILDTVTVNPSPTAISTPALQSVCSGLSTSLALTSDVAGTDFNWTVTAANVSGASAGNGTSIAQVLTATAATNGTVQYSVTPSYNGCSGIPVDIPVTVFVPVTATIDTTMSACGVCAGSISVTANAGTSPYSFTWLPLPASVVSTANTSDATGLCAGVYNVTITDNNSCSSNFAIGLNNSNGITGASVVTNDISCFGDCNGSGTVTPIGGTFPYTYLWNDSPPAATATTIATANSLCAGNYLVQITDLNTCVYVSNVTINQPVAALTAIIASQTDIPCFGSGNIGSVTIDASNGTPGYSYSIDGFISTQYNGTFSGLAAGSYTISVKDTNNCGVSIPVTITAPATNVSGAITSQTNVSCAGASTGCVTVSGSGGTPGYTYQLDANPFQASGTFCSLPAGSYAVTVKDANGCTALVPVTITGSAISINASIISQTSILCKGDSTASLTVSGSNGTPSYLYSLDNISFQPSGTFNNLFAGSGTAYVIDAVGCSTTLPYTITEPLLALTGSISSQTNVLCKGDASGCVTVSGNGGTIGYSYSKDGISFQAGGTFCNLPAGSYTLTVKDTNSCTATVLATIVEPAIALSASITSQTNVLCKGGNSGSVTVLASNGTAGYTYKLGAGAQQTSGTFNNLLAGNYSVLVTDTNGCTVTLPVTITEPATVLSASITSQTNIICKGENTGSVTVLASNGTAGYTYSLGIVTGQPSGTFSGLSAGNYTVIATDMNGCTFSVPVTITEPAIGLSASITSQTNVLCNGGNTGSITITAINGTPGYLYSMNGGVSQLNGTFSGLAAGIDSVLVTDTIGCSTIVKDTITVTSPIVFAPSTLSTLLCHGDANGVITVFPTGGTLPYSYSWSAPAVSSGNQATNLVANSYTVTVTDSNGCVASHADTLTEPPVLTISHVSVNPTCNTIADGSINITVGGGSPGTSPAYSFSWSGASSAVTEDLSGILIGTYSIQVTDFNGCKISDSVTLTAPVTVTANAGNDTSFCESGSINLNAALSINALNYQWFDMAGNSLATSVSVMVNPPSGQTSYYVLVDNGSLCSDKDTITITSNPAPIANAGLDTIWCQAGALTLSAAGSSNATGYDWFQMPSNSNIGSSVTITVTPTLGGTSSYYVVAGSAFGCYANDTVNVIANPLPIASAGNDSSFCEITNAPFTLNAAGSTNAASYSWYEIPSNTLISSANTGSVIPSATSSYYVVVNNGAGCLSRDTINLITYPYPIADAGSNFSILSGYTATLGGNPTGPAGSTYLWALSTSIDNDISANPQANPTGTTTYTVTVTSSQGCVSIDSILITVVPNIFYSYGISPNGDGVNDDWEIEFIDFFPNNVVEIYNRWGELLFQSKGYKQRFDGTYKGEPLPVGTYYYIINLNDPLYPDARTGPITIMR